MYLIQILLPLSDNTGARFPDQRLKAIQAELAAQFNGLTAYARAPAEGIWAHQGVRTTDDIVIVEVMTDSLDKRWWRQFRNRVEQLLRQQYLVVRAYPVEML